MRPEPFQRVEHTEEIFSVASPEAARLIIDKLAEVYPQYDFECKRASFSNFIQIRVGAGLDDKQFHLLAGFAYGFFSGIEHLYPVGIVKCEAR